MVLLFYDIVNNYVALGFLAINQKSIMGFADLRKKKGVTF